MAGETFRIASFPNRSNRASQALEPTPRTPHLGELIEDSSRALATGREALCSSQVADGTWRLPAAIDVVATAGLVLLDRIAGLDDSDRTDRLCRGLRNAQRQDGLWSGEMCDDLSASVLVYLALKSAGASPADPQLRGARVAIQSLGGAGAVNREVADWLALAGQIEHPPQTAKLRLPAREGIGELFVVEQQTNHSAAGEPPIGTRTELRRQASEWAPGQTRSEICLETDAENETLYVPIHQESLKTSASALIALRVAGAREGWAPVDQGTAALHRLDPPREAESIAAMILALGAVPSEGRAASKVSEWPKLMRDAPETTPAIDGPLEAVEAATIESLVQTLVSLQTESGAWTDPHGPCPAATAAAICALQALGSGAPRDSILSGDRFLELTQRRDGGWRTVGATSDSEATALATLALCSSGATDSGDAGLNWLLAAQEEGGMWEAGSIAATAAALQALTAGGMADSDETLRAVDALLQGQDSLGGWGPCPADSAAALNALGRWVSAAGPLAQTGARASLRLALN